MESKIFAMRMAIPVFLVLIFGASLSLPTPICAESPRPQEFRGNVIVNGTPSPPGSIVTVKTGGVQIASVTTDSRGRYGFNIPLLVSANPGARLEFYINGVKAKETANCKSGEMTVLNLTVDPDSTIPASDPPASELPEAILTENYTITDLKISPASAKPGEPVIITAQILNTDKNAGIFKVMVLVNNLPEIEQTVSLGAGKTQKLVYSLTRENQGNYTISISDRNASFSVTGSNTSGAGLFTGTEWWIYAIAGIAVILVILVTILLISRRNSSYF
jgi:hypothetical protein